MSRRSASRATASRSGCVPAATRTHCAHVPQAPVGPGDAQSSSMAKASATVRFPTPGGPAKT
jgi:hypothetical protein